MKRYIALLLLFVLAGGTASAESLYEKQLEYRRKRIEILVQTRYVSELEKQKEGDTHEYTYTSDGGYTYKTTTKDERTGITSELRKISDWVIVKGGIRELSDHEFLFLTGNDKSAREIQDKVQAREMWRNIGMLTGLIGIGVVIAGSNSADSGTITSGALVSLLGVMISAFNYPIKHYIYPDYAQEQADKYNIRVKRELELPVDFE